MRKLCTFNLFFLILISIQIIYCQNNIDSKQKPNIILIMADDIGFEALSINGSTSYNTPVLDSLAINGINFTNTISQPLCTPSRVKIMTGKYNFRNYEHFTYLNSNQKTFGNLFKENGYKTAIVGKWQLNGIVHKLDGYDDVNRPYEFGFDEYCLWQLTKRKTYGERFSNPLIVQNGIELSRDEEAYGPEIVSDYAIDFIQKNKDNPFFIYYPMLLVHDPFVPTPDSPEWESLDTRSSKNNRFFIDMVAYMDKIVGKIVGELKTQGIADNTLILFVGDNGTNRNLISQTINGPVVGGKGKTITHGVHVPMVASWPSQIKNFSSYSGLINFSDFYATFSDILDVKNESDGISMLDIFSGTNIKDRETATIYYDSKWGKNEFRNVFSQNHRYKLYKDGRFFDMENDILEKKPINNLDMTKAQKKIKTKLAYELSFFSKLPPKDSYKRPSNN